MPELFQKFFQLAVGYKPYPYQVGLARERICSKAISVPTGAGKTAAVVLAWLWRLQIDPEETPRRLVYCLPMRTLVEQTRDKAQLWKNAVAPTLGLYTLMGGEVEEKWEIEPERPSILVGTQDMLLSRALNRGYAMSRYQWPVHFGLLNNDCLWVCDEVQLMGSGLGTTTQLQAWREEMGGFGPRATWWMSATMDKTWLQTVDYESKADALPVNSLRADDLSDAGIEQRYTAPKPLQPLGALAESEIASRIWDRHQAAGSLTLAVVNTVDRAQKIFGELSKRCGKSKNPPELLLAHSSRMQKNEAPARIGLFSTASPSDLAARKMRCVGGYGP